MDFYKKSKFSMLEILAPILNPFQEMKCSNFEVLSPILNPFQSKSSMECVLQKGLAAF